MRISLLAHIQLIAFTLIGEIFFSDIRFSLPSIVMDFDIKWLPSGLPIEMLYFLQSYSLLFHFTPNEYFKQTVLKKWYKLQLTPDEDDPFDFDGPMVVEAKGLACSI